jgi:hypothetical protein
MLDSFGSDPLVSSWMIALSALFVFAVAVPVLRLVVALGIHAYAAITGQQHLHRAAAHVMPRTAQLIGSLLFGIGSIAAPALAAGDEPSVASINLDRDAGATGSAAAAHSTPVLRSTATPPATRPHATTARLPVDLDRDGGASQVASETTSAPTRTVQHASRADHAAGSIYVVRTGDSLWSIAHSQLDDPTDSGVTEGWKAIWRANRAIIGDHPELIHPGQRIMLPPGALA